MLDVCLKLPENGVEKDQWYYSVISGAMEGEFFTVEPAKTFWL